MNKIFPITFLSLLFCFNNQYAQLDSIPRITGKDLQDFEEDRDYTPALLHDFRDAFQNATNFSFSTSLFFNPRGLDSEYKTVYMLGLPMNDLENGRARWSQWGGLNRVTRGYQSIGLNIDSKVFSGLGSTWVNPRASYQRKRAQFEYAITNRNYNHRLMGTYNTGMMKGGWAVSMAASRRWAQEGFDEGTFYDAWSYFLSVEKYFGQNHQLSFTTFGTPTDRGRSGPAIEELFELAGTNFYNPRWGYQNGKKRNANIARNFEPIHILAHEWDNKKQTSILTSVGFQHGRNGNTAIDWYNAADPRPDYYRKLPSYVLEQPAGPNQALADEIRTFYLNNPDALQLDFDKFYEVNRSPSAEKTFDNVDGIEGNTVTGNLSKYVLEERRYDSKKLTFSSSIQSAIKEHTVISGGVNFQYQRKHNYKLIDDLLGGDFYVNFNEFAERDFPDNPDANQFDLNNPNRLVTEGEKFGWDYFANMRRAAIWVQGAFTFNKVDFFASTELSHSCFHRDGNTRFGLFPENSFGKSERQNFLNYSTKAGLTYKINGRNYFLINGLYMTKAPNFRNSFVSPRTRNTVADNLTDEKIHSLEGGYVYRSSKFKFSAIAYYLEVKDRIETMNFYHEGFRNFVNYTTSGIDTRHTGAELGIFYAFHPTFSISAAASIGKHIYTSRQQAVVTLDNDGSALEPETVYSKGFFVPGSPQTAYTVGLRYSSPKFWFVNLSANYVDNQWLDFNPTRRTAGAVDDVVPDTEEFRNIIDQRQAPEAFTMNIFGGYSWKMDKTIDKMKNSYYLVFNVGINNLTNNTNIVQYGFEQLRFDEATNNPERFPYRVKYGYGLNYFISLGFRM